jgi:large-conductance mechanosensitive channel
MLSNLKPNKSNVVGTVLLLAASYVGGFVSRIVSGLIVPRGGGQYAGAASQYAGTAGRGAMAGGTFGTSGLVSGAINFVILAILFYVIISLVPVMFAKPQESREEKGEAGKAASRDKK